GWSSWPPTATCSPGGSPPGTVTSSPGSCSAPSSTPSSRPSRRSTWSPSSRLTIQPPRSRRSSRYCVLQRTGLVPATRLAVIMKLKLDLHDIYNRGQDIDRALQAIIDEAEAKYHRVEKDSKNFGRLFIHFRW